MEDYTVKTIMEKFQKRYNDIFLINNDKSLSTNLIERIDGYYANVFNGNNGYFTSEDLIANEYAVIENGEILLKDGAIICTSPFKYIKGEYIVACNLKEINNNNNIRIEIVNDEKDIIFCNDYIDCKSEVVETEISLNDDIDTLQIRIKNIGNSEFIVSSIKIVAKEQILLKKALEREQQIEEDSLKPETSQVYMDGYIPIDLAGTAEMASCFLPVNTRFRFIKRVVRRIMKTYTRQQIDFNKQTVNIICQLKTYIDETINQEEIRRYKEAQKLSRLELELDKQHVQINKQDEQIYEQDNQIDELVKELEKKNYQIEALNNELKKKNEQLENQAIEIENIWKFNKDVNQNFASVWKEYQQLRNELFYEINSGINTRKSKMESKDIAVEIKDSALVKIENNNGMIRLNVGSGPYDVDGYLSVDARNLKNVDVVADAIALPYPDSSVDEIYSAHLIEHFTIKDLENKVIPHWRDKLKTGGVLNIVFPDLEEMLKDYRTGDLSFENLARVIMGAQDYSLDYHYCVLSEEIVISLLKKTGFQKIEVIDKGRKNDICRETEIRATK